MKRTLMALVAGAVLFGAVAPATAVPQPVRIEREMESKCRFQWVDPGEWTQREEFLTATCITSRWPVPGGYAQLNCVASHESGWNRFAYNPNGHVGLFQHDEGAWRGRVYRARNVHPYWRIPVDWRNSFTQLLVTDVMVRGDGDWHQWTTC